DVACCAAHLDPGPVGRLGPLHEGGARSLAAGRRLGSQQRWLWCDDRVQLSARDRARLESGLAELHRFCVCACRRTIGFRTGFGSPLLGLIAGVAGFSAVFLASAVVVFCAGAIAIRLLVSPAPREEAS